MRSVRQVSRPSTALSPVRLRLEALDLRLPPSSLIDTLADDLILAPPPPTEDDPNPGAVAVVVGSDSNPDPAPSAVVLDPADPSAGTLPPPPSADEEPSPLFVPPPNLAPQIANFVGVEIVGGLWRFSGDVIDEAPAGLIVSFGGEPISLQGLGALTDLNGHFVKIVPMNVDGSDNGLASARTFDIRGAFSNLALCNVNPG
jgi:hypothetical protein